MFRQLRIIHKELEGLEVFKKIVFWICFSFAVVFFFPTNKALSVEVDYSSPQKYTLSKIHFLGIKYLDENSIRGLTKLKIGQEITIPSEELTLSLKALWDEQLFSDIKMYLGNIDGNKASLIFEVVERDRLYKINFSGVSKSDVSKFNEEYAEYIGKVLSESDTYRIKERVKKLLS